MAWRLDKDGAALYEPFSTDDIACRDEELAWMDKRERSWTLVNGELARKSAEMNARPWKRVLDGIDGPIAGLGFAALEASPGSANLATITPAAATETALWSVPNQTPIQNPTLPTQQYPKAFRLVAFGTQTTPASPGTLTLTPRLGQVVGGQTLGASSAVAQTASETAILWKIWGDVVLRIGGGASTATAIGHFNYIQQTGTAGPGIFLTGIFQIFGGTVATYDGSGATLLGLWMGATIATSSTSTFIPHAVIWSSWN